jgi:hypothetical protein
VTEEAALGSASTMWRSRSATSTRRSDWYGKIFDFNLRNRQAEARSAFIDMGDQFINMTRVPITSRTASSGAISALSSTTARV